MSLIVIQTGEEYSAIKKSDGINAIYFSATWCKPCQVICPLLEELSETNKNIKFHKVDVDDNPDAGEEECLVGMPAMVIYRNGELKDVVYGEKFENYKNALSKF